MLNITIREIKSKLQWGITSHWSELLLFSHSVMSDSCNPMDCSTAGFHVLHYPPEFAQTHVYWVSEPIQPSHPLSPSFPPALSLAQHQGLFQWVGPSHQVAQCIGVSASASVPPVNIQGWFPLGLAGLISLVSKGLSKAFSSITDQKHQFFGAQPSLWSNSLWLYGPLSAKWCLCFIIHCLGFNTMVRMGIIKNSTNKKAEEDVEKREPSCAVGGNVNWYNNYGEQYDDS